MFTFCDFTAAGVLNDLFYPLDGFFILLIEIGILIIMFAIFKSIMPCLTEYGMGIKEKLKGFKLFLSTVEKDRVKFHFSPQANPEKFADYLPYAIIFRVEKEWAKLFEGVGEASPSWYQGTGGVPVSAFYVASGLGKFNSSIRSSSLVSYSAAAAGRSGFSRGGGFSGGGVGGGGGSSW